MIPKYTTLILVLGLALLHAASAGAADRMAGPVPADLVGVLDGDTLEVDALIWLGQRLRVKVRLAGIDTPEFNGACDGERQAAEAARAAVLALVEGAAGLTLYEVENDKYAGRVLARVLTAEGIDLAATLLDQGLARLYDGGTRQGWCELAQVGGASPP